MIGRVASIVLAGLSLAALAQTSPVHIKDPAKRKAFYKALSKGELSGSGGNWKSARQAYREAIKVAPEVVEGHHGYQDAMDRLGQSEACVQQYRGKLKRQPKNPLAYYLLARVLPDVKEKE